MAAIWHVARLHEILALKALGLSLKKIGETLDRDSPAIGQILDLQARQLASDIRTAKDRLKRVQQARKYLAKHGEVPLDLLLELTRNLAPPRQCDVRIVPGRRHVSLQPLILLGLELYFGLELIEQPDRIVPLDLFLVAVGYPCTDEHADDDDGQFDCDRYPVLRSQSRCNPLVNHDIPNLPPCP